MIEIQNIFRISWNKSSKSREVQCGKRGRGRTGRSPKTTQLGYEMEHPRGLRWPNSHHVTSECRSEIGCSWKRSPKRCVYQMVWGSRTSRQVDAKAKRMATDRMKYSYNITTSWFDWSKSWTLEAAWSKSDSRREWISLSHRSTSSKTIVWSDW